MANSWGNFHKVSGAGWTLFWRIPDQSAGGLELWFAEFMGKRVLWKGSQPFAIVPYHHPLRPDPILGTVYPTAPDFTFKDGLGPMCGGAPFTALKWWSPNDWNGPKWVAESDREAIRIERSAETTFEPASITVASKFQSGWYQYVQHWKFDGYGEIHAELGMGGALHPVNADKAHVHHMYFRLDFDVDGSERQFFDVFSHGGFDDTSTGDRWQVQPTQGKHLLDPSSARKFRVRAARPRGGTDNMSPGYEIEVPAQAGMDSHSTGDIWAATYRRGIAGPLEEGETVGNAACNDLELDQFATGPLNSRTGSDVVLWVVVRHHHEPRSLAEENKGLPYHYEGFHLVPRGLTKFGYLNNVYPWQDGAESAPPEPKE